MVLMAANMNEAMQPVGGHGTHDIFRRLGEGVDDLVWRQYADSLRGLGFGVFDLRIAGEGDVELISPDCLSWWQVRVEEDGRWRLH